MKHHLVKAEDLMKMREILADKLELDPKKITLKSNLMNDFGADSLDIYELTYSFEEEFGILVPDEEIWQHLEATNFSVKGMVQLACKHIKQNQIKSYSNNEHVRNYLMERGMAA